MRYTRYMTGMKKYKVYALKEKDGTIVYVGQTRQELSRRFSAHKCSKRLPHLDIYIELIADFDEPEPMYKLEGMLIEQYNLVENGWNNSYGHKNCPKQVRQDGELNSFYGHKHRKEVCEAIGKRSIGNSYAKGNRSRKGMKNSEYHNKRISECKSKKVMCIDTGEVFKSGREAAKKLKLQPSKISLVCNGKRKATGGLRFCFVD